MAKKKSEKAPRYFENEILNVDREMLCKLHGWNLKLYIVLLNHFNGLTPDDLCAYLKAARRTVYRAIAFMKKKGLIIEKEGGFLCLNLCQNLKEEADKTDKEKRTKKEKEKITRKNYAPALEGVRARPADFYLDCLCDDDDTLRALCKINRLTVENPDDHNQLCQVLHTYMTDFIDMLIAQGKKNFTHDEVKAYFANWLPKKRQEDYKKEAERKKREAEIQRREAEEAEWKRRDAEWGKPIAPATSASPVIAIFDNTAPEGEDTDLPF